MFRALSLAIVVVIFGLPLAVVTAPAIFFPQPFVILVTLFFLPFLYSCLFVLTAGLLSRPFQKAIVEGKFPRDLKTPLYRSRRLYGLCWTCVYYFKPIYSICLSVSFLKTMMFRLFGYRGQMDFTIYPDTWIRDLPLLRIGAGAYISNKATLGTNMPLQNGQILVEGIEIGAGALIGHLTMVGAGAKLGDGCEISHGAACGVRASLGKRSFFGVNGVIAHMAEIGDDVQIGHFSYAGVGARVGSGIKFPGGSLIPQRARVKTQEDAMRYISSETKDFNQLHELFSRVASERERLGE
jgi:carbonic anhydrase/acetyltransferase-like protein (isoleucine patch superfamily)